MTYKNFIVDVMLAIWISINNERVRRQQSRRPNYDYRKLNTKINVNVGNYKFLMKSSHLNDFRNSDDGVS